MNSISIQDMRSDWEKYKGIDLFLSAWTEGGQIVERFIGRVVGYDAEHEVFFWKDNMDKTDTPYNHTISIQLLSPVTKFIIIKYIYNVPIKRTGTI